VIIDLRKPYQWDEINDAVKSSLGFEGSIKVFQSVSQAVFEIAMSVQNLYAHKRQFYHSLGLGTHADEGILFLARQGIKGIDFLAGETPTIDDKKTLFWLSDVDDAISGQVFHDPATSNLDSKVFRIWISHRQHFVKPPPKTIGDNDIFIYANEVGPVITHFGRRAQSLQMLLAPTLKWDQIPVFKGFESRAENKTWVQKVESEKWAGSQAFFQSQPGRLYDRALIVWKNHDSEAVRELLIQAGVPAAAVETVSLSRWNETKLITQFEKRGHDAEVFRGLLILSATLASDAGLKTKLEKVIQDLDKRSTF